MSASLFTFITITTAIKEQNVLERHELINYLCAFKFEKIISFLPIFSTQIRKLPKSGTKSKTFTV
jgi:hypothetical protein